MEKQGSKKLWGVLLLTLLALILSILGVLVEMGYMDPKGNGEPMAEWIPMLVVGILFAVFDALNFSARNMVLPVPLFSMLLLAAGAFLLLQKSTTGRKLGIRSLWTNLILNMVMEALFFMQALLGAVLGVIPAFWGLLAGGLQGAGICLLLPGFGILEGLQVREYDLRCPEKDPEALWIRRRKISALLILLVLLAGLMLRLSLVAGMQETEQGGIMNPFFDRFWKDAQNAMGGGIILILFAGLLWLTDAVLFILADVGILLGAILGGILAVTAWILIRRERQKAGKVCAAWALALETGPFFMELILIGICLKARSLPLIPWGISAGILCLTAGALLLLGFWLLPELGCFPKQPEAHIGTDCKES